MDQKLIRVRDNWYPCLKGHKIELSLFLFPSVHIVRICAYGNDDFGVAMEYCDTNYDNLLSKYNEWKENIFDKAKDGIDKNWFYRRGFHDS